MTSPYCIVIINKAVCQISVHYDIRKWVKLIMQDMKNTRTSQGTK